MDRDKITPEKRVEIRAAAKKVVAGGDCGQAVLDFINLTGPETYLALLDTLDSAEKMLKNRTKDEIHGLIEKYGDPQYKTNEFAIYDLIAVVQQLWKK